MDEKIDELVMKANKSKRYQILMIILGILIYLITSVLSSTFGYLIVVPIVDVIENGKIIEKNVNLNQTICSKYQYKITSLSKSTWTYSYQIECSPLLSSMVNTLGNIGSLVGFCLTPISINLFGEKASMLWSGYAYAVICVVNIWMPEIYSALLFVFLNNFTGSVMGLVNYMMLSEISPGNVRPISLSIITSGYSICAIEVILMFRYLNSWKVPLIATGILALLVTICVHIFLFENPRYYLKRGDVVNFVKTLKKIAKVNRCDQEFDKIANKVLREYNEELDDHNFSNTSNHSNQSLLMLIKEYTDNFNLDKKEYNIIDLLKFKSHRYIFLLLCYLNGIGGGIYQFISNDITNLPGNAYIDGYIVNSIEFVSAFLTGLIMNIAIFGRKHLLYFTVGVGLIINILFIFISFPSIWITILSQTLRILYNFMTGFLSVYNMEVYSSKLVNVGYSWNYIFYLIGASFLPTGIQYWDSNTQNILFASFGAIGIISIYFLPETKNRPQLCEIEEERLEINHQKI